jgi:hypothetical protein
MKLWWFVVLGLIVIGVSVACLGLGWWAGRSAAQQITTPVEGIPVAGGTTASSASSASQRLRLYYGPEIDGNPAYTIVDGRVYRENSLDDPILTLREHRVYAGDHPDAPLLFRFTDDKIVEGAGDGPVRFIQEGNRIHVGPDPSAPTVFTFAGTHIYRGTADDGRILATTNAVVINADLVKLMALVLYMDTLE